MASIQKYKNTMVKLVFQHNNRRAGEDIKRDNDKIDPSRIADNYHIKYGTIDSFNERLSNIYHNGRKDEVQMIEVIVHQPNDLKDEDERKFFEAVYEFYANDFGEENVISACVHRDETRNHIHIAIIPTIIEDFTPKENFRKREEQERVEKWKNEHGQMERLCCYKKLSRPYYNSMHQRLTNFITNVLGYEVEILNGATDNGNRTVLQLKNETLQKEIDEKENIVKHYEEEVKRLFLLSRNLGMNPDDISLYPLVERIAGLEKQNKILQNIIRQNGFRFSKEQIESLRTTRSPVKSTPFKVRSGTMKNFDIDERGIVVIEVQQYPDRVYTPQRPMFDSEPNGRFDLERPFRRFLASREEVWATPSRQTDNMYMFVKANDIQQLLQNLIYMQRLIDEENNLKERRIYIEQFECDAYNFAKNVLEQSACEVNYFVKTTFEKTKTEQKEKEI